VATLKELGREERFLEVLATLGARLRRELGAGELSAAEAEGLRAALPGNAAAARLYAEGLAALRLSNAPAALHLLEQAAAADPDNPRLESALAGAWSALGYDRQAKEHAGRALDRSAGLPPEERQGVEAGARQVAGEWEKAAVLYKALWEQFPDNLEYGLRLATVETEAAAPPSPSWTSCGVSHRRCGTIRGSTSPRPRRPARSRISSARRRRPRGRRGRPRREGPG
jgi:tetratricopeptide (TPR) repeat protein